MGDGFYQKEICTLDFDCYKGIWAKPLTLIYVYK